MTTPTNIWTTPLSKSGVAGYRGMVVVSVDAVSA